jgi:hypothetical protein
MAQTGFTPIVTYNTATATTVPSAANLAQGELAVNVTDKKLYTKDSGGNVVLLASNGGDVTGPASSTNLAIPTFSGTGGKTLLDNSGVTISAGVVSGTGFTGALNGALGATTPSTAVVTSINKMAITAPATSSTLAVADGKTLTASNSLTLAGTDGTTQTFPATSATIARTDAAQTFTGLQTFGALTTTGNVILGDATTDTLTVGVTGIVKDASGNVGIGTATPNTKLNIVGTNTTTVSTASTYLGLGKAENGLGGLRLIGFGFNPDSSLYVYPSYIGYIETANTSGTAGDLVAYTRPNGSAATVVPTERMRITNAGDIYGTAGTTAMTTGFFYIPSAAGAPSGVPTAIAGHVPMYYDTTNNFFYVYNGAWKKILLA